MKRPYLFILLAAVVIVSSCQKQDVEPAATQTSTQESTQTSTPTPSSIVAKWDLVKDSTWAQLIGPPSISVYKGTSNDYYDFRADGKCYICEKGAYDTINYKIASDTSVAFGDPVAGIDATTGKTIYFQPRPTVIDPLTDHSAAVNFSYASSGGPSNRTVYLSK